jgi:hypothetical protein
MYNFKILYIKESKNARADALSRKPEYLNNKTYISRAILKSDKDNLTFNYIELAVIIVIITDY